MVLDDGYVWRVNGQDRWESGKGGCELAQEREEEEEEEVEVECIRRSQTMGKWIK